jgi:SAM-dependent methyltransferase
MTAGYRVLPSVYDRWQRLYGKDYSTAILPRLLSSLRRYKVSKTSLLDLACGTGTLAIALARRGWKVWGVDGSEGMVARAWQKTADHRVGAVFLQQPMQALELPEQVGVVVSMFDSINHLTSRRDLVRVFKRVHNVLRPDGYFIFDVNNEHCYTSLWQRTDVMHHEEFTVILENSYDSRKKMAESRVTLFEKKATSFDRMCEVVRERCYPPVVLRGLLIRTGFTVLECEDFTFTARSDVGPIKTWWVAKRNE